MAWPERKQDTSHSVRSISGPQPAALVSQRKPKHSASYRFVRRSSHYRVVPERLCTDRTFTWYSIASDHAANSANPIVYTIVDFVARWQHCRSGESLAKRQSVNASRTPSGGRFQIAVSPPTGRQSAALWLRDALVADGVVRRRGWSCVPRRRTADLWIACSTTRNHNWRTDVGQRNGLSCAYFR